MSVLAARDINSAADRIRLAQLSVDSDRVAGNSLLVAAAKDAVFLANLTLGERLARSAFERGDGLRAAELLSRAVLWGVPRLSTLFWSMGEVAHGQDILDLMRQRVSQPALRLIVEATGAAMAVHQTVEGHIYRACIKLDISDREELAAIVARSDTA